MATLGATLSTTELGTLGAESADVTTSQTTTSTSYVDLTTTGPAVTLTTGTTQKHLLSVTAFVSVGTWDRCAAAPSIAGAAAADVDMLGLLGNNVSAAAQRASSLTLAAAQASGSTHTEKYKVTGGTGAFSNRRIIGVPM